MSRSPGPTRNSSQPQAHPPHCLARGWPYCPSGGASDTHLTLPSPSLATPPPSIPPSWPPPQMVTPSQISNQACWGSRDGRLSLPSRPPRLPDEGPKTQLCQRAPPPLGSPLAPYCSFKSARSSAPCAWHRSGLFPSQMLFSPTWWGCRLQRKGGRGPRQSIRTFRFSPSGSGTGVGTGPRRAGQSHTRRPWPPERVHSPLGVSSCEERGGQLGSAGCKDGGSLRHGHHLCHHME